MQQQLKYDQNTHISTEAKVNKIQIFKRVVHNVEPKRQNIVLRFTGIVWCHCY